jgi:HD-GYP domain-containing protein (c-di-GMP phosphodiesterase class II)
MMIQMIDSTEGIQYQDYRHYFNHEYEQAWNLLSDLYFYNRSAYEHSLRVGKLVGVILNDLNEDAFAQYRTELVMAGFLHDVGKLKISNKILKKPAGLNFVEWSQVKTHPLEGESLVRKVVLSGFVLDAVRSHHERWDGSGYPNGLRGEEIPMQARLLSICDAIDAMVSERPYKHKITISKCLEELVGNAGTQFDPELVGRIGPRLTFYLDLLYRKI